MEDYYNVLGVDENASQDEIKKAYRKLSLIHHPDKNQGNLDAETKFKKINEAYQIVGDENERKQYDMKRRNPFGGGMPQNHGHPDPHGMNPMNDIFKMFFGGGSPFGSQFDDMSGMNQFQQESMQRMRKCEPKIVVIPISLLDIYIITSLNHTLYLNL